MNIAFSIEKQKYSDPLKEVVAVSIPTNTEALTRRNSYACLCMDTSNNERTTFA